MATQLGSVELQQVGGVEDGSLDHHRRARELVLDSADPPSIFREVYSAAKSKVLPGKTCRGKSRSKTRRNRVASFFVALFPILRWGRSYKASMFRHDLMSGLTLASLCIPQVILFMIVKYIYIFHLKILKTNIFIVCAEHWVCKSSEAWPPVRALWVLLLFLYL